jgi:hypothetical protein
MRCNIRLKLGRRPQTPAAGCTVAATSQIDELVQFLDVGQPCREQKRWVLVVVPRYPLPPEKGVCGSGDDLLPV